MTRQQAEEEQQEEEVTCPECEGTNLNKDKTLCFDCQSEDFE
jgi:ribosomal protein L37AE/L43A